MANKEPQHLEIFDVKVPWYRWDWRKENPGEVILFVFAMVIFLTIPKAGCGITPQDASVGGEKGAPAAVEAIEAKS